MKFRVHYVAGLTPGDESYEDIVADTIDYDIDDVFRLMRKVTPNASILVRAVPYTSVTSIEPLIDFEALTPAPGTVGGGTIIIPDEGDVAAFGGVEEVEERVAVAPGVTLPGWQGGPALMPPDGGEGAMPPMVGTLPPITPTAEREGTVVMPARFLDKEVTPSPRPTPAPKTPDTPAPSTFGQ